MANLTLKVKVKFTSFKVNSNLSKTSRRSMNSSNMKLDFQMGQFRSLKLICCKLKGQSVLEGQGQGSSVFEIIRDL